MTVPANAVASSSRPKKSRLVPGETPYHESSQYRRWRFSAAQLAERREELNAKAVASVSANIAEDKELHLAASTWIEPKNPPTFPSVQEEQLPIAYYERQIIKFCESGYDNPLPEIIAIVAISYLKRFYLVASCIEWHPRTIMPVCIFLAAKTNNKTLAVDDFVNKFAKLKREDILDLEFTVLQKLKFDMFVYKTASSLHGWFLKLQELPIADIPRTTKAFQTSRSHLSKSRFTDAEFTYTPSQITLACFRISDRELVDALLDFLHPEPVAVSVQAGGEDVAMTGDGAEEEKVKKDAKEAEFERKKMGKRRLLEVLDEIQGMIENEPEEIELSSVKEADKKLRSCQDPLKNPDSALSKKRLSDIQAKLAEKRASKLLKAQAEMSSRDTLFGGPIIGAPHSHSGKPHMDESGMGIKLESGGMMFGGEGLRDVAMEMEDSDSDMD